MTYLLEYVYLYLRKKLMETAKFNEKLKEMGLSKKEFSEESMTAYQTVMNWSAAHNTPEWVEPFLRHYERSKAFEQMLGALKKFKPCS